MLSTTTKKKIKLHISSVASHKTLKNLYKAYKKGSVEIDMSIKQKNNLNVFISMSHEHGSSTKFNLELHVWKSSKSLGTDENDADMDNGKSAIVMTSMSTINTMSTDVFNKINELYSSLK